MLALAADSRRTVRGRRISGCTLAPWRVLPQTDITDLHINPRGADGWRDWWQRWRRSITTTGNFPAYPSRPTYSKGFQHQGQPVVMSEAGNFLIAELPPDGPWKAYGEGSPYHPGPIATVKEYVATYRDYFLALTAAPECAGFSYVQLYDVEGEVNGYLTYNRKPKVPAIMIAGVHDEVLRARAAINRDRAGQDW